MALLTTYLVAEKQHFIATGSSSIVFYVFIALFFTVYLILASISLYRQTKKEQIFTRSIVTVTSLP